MAEDQTSSGDGGRERRGTSAWVGLLQAAGARLVPLVISASALLGFVAFAGAVIVWTRFFAVKVPPDQVVTAVPRNELVATGSSLLLLFGFFGVLAVLATYLIDRGGRATPGMARGLLALLTAEGVTAILIDTGQFDGHAWAAIGLFVGPLLLIVAITFLDQFTTVADTLQARKGEHEDPRPRPLHTKEKKRLIKNSDLIAGVVLLASVGLAASLILLGVLPDWLRFALVGALAVAAITVLFLLTGRVLELGRALKNKQATLRTEEETEEANEKKEEKARKQQVAEADEAVDLAREELRELREKYARSPKLLGGLRYWLGSAKPGGTTPAEARAEHVLQRCEEDLARLRSEYEAWEGSGRRDKPRSYRLQFRVTGLLVATPAIVAATWFPVFVLHELWVVVSLAAAAALTLALWRIAALSKRGFIWFGLAVFISVPLFGTLALMARNLDDPQVQPVALIRSTDGPDEAIQGLYVTEGHDRVYFATVAIEGCTDDLRGGSGRLLWVPKEEVVAMSVGPLQSVGDAARASLEMAYALTPAVETPSGAAVSLRVEAEQAEAEALVEGDTEREPRLENTGPAVRPTFGTGIRLEPEGAVPGQVVTLSVSAPNGEIDGFGESREGRNLRVGGVPAAIVKSRANRLDNAEFIKTAGGEVLPLDKQGLYVRERQPQGEQETWAYELAEDGTGGQYFVRLDERSGVARTLNPKGRPIPQGEDGGLFLKALSRGIGAPRRLVRGQKVEFHGAEPARVEKHLLRQAWREDKIRFRVPENATTGVVEVECDQLAGQPLLQIERPPRAKVSARVLGSGKILLDSRGSGDEGGKIVRRWTVDGQPRFRGRKKGKKGPVGRKTAQLELPRRLGLHHVQLTVEDEMGETDAASVYLARLPDPGVEEWKLEQVRSSLARRARKEAPTVVKVDGHVRTGSVDPAHEAAKAARRAARRVLTRESAEAAKLEDSEVAVVVRSFGADCGLLPANAAQDRHVDVFALTEGFQLKPPRHCRPLERERRVWVAKEPSDSDSGDDQAVPADESESESGS